MTSNNFMKYLVRGAVSAVLACSFFAASVATSGVEAQVVRAPPVHTNNSVGGMGGYNAPDLSTNSMRDLPDITLSSPSMSVPRPDIQLQEQRALPANPPRTSVRREWHYQNYVFPDTNQYATGDGYYCRGSSGWYGC